MSWEGVQALRHYKLGMEIPTTILDVDDRTTYQWMQGYGLQYGVLPDDALLAAHVGAQDLGPLPAWPEVQALLLDKYVQRSIQPAINAFIQGIEKPGHHVEATQALMRSLTTVLDVTVVEDQAAAFAAGAMARAEDYGTRLGRAYNPRIGLFGLPTLDMVVNGFEIGDFILMYAKPKQGKSTLKRQIVCNLLRQGLRVLSITLENPRPIEMMEMETLFTRTPPKDYLRYTMAPADFVSFKDALGELAGPGMGEAFVYDRLPSRDWVGIADLALKHRVDIVVVDQLTNLAGREWKDIQRSATEGRKFAQDSRIPTLAITQSNDDGAMKYAKAMVEEGVKVLSISDNAKVATDMKYIEVKEYRRGPAGQKIPITFDPDNGIVEEMASTTPSTDYAAAAAPAKPTMEQIIDNMPWNQGDAGSMLS